MSQGSKFDLGVVSKVGFWLARLRERLWLKPLLSCVLSLAAVFAAVMADRYYPGAEQSLPSITSKSIETILSITSGSMLVIAVFAVGAMVAAYASAGRSATPRTFPLVVGDDVSQNALSAFIGAFIFSIVALVTVLNDVYGQAGRYVVFLITLGVIALVVLSFVRWVDRIARLGRLGNTVDKVEAATDDALKRWAEHPTLGASTASTPDQQGTAVYSATVGYVQNIDVEELQQLAEQLNTTISVCALPGAFVTPGGPLAYIAKQDLPAEERLPESVLEAFVIADQRSFESDPRFGLVVLSEIASRALSPGVNDPGTAIDIIGTLVRLFTRWHQAREERDGDEVEYPRVTVAEISLNDMFDDAFNPIARDGAGLIEVATRLQKALHTLALLGHDEMKRAAAQHAVLAFRYAEQSLRLPEELESLRSAAEPVLGEVTATGRHATERSPRAPEH